MLQTYSTGQANVGLGTHIVAGGQVISTPAFSAIKRYPSYSQSNVL